MKLGSKLVGSLLRKKNTGIVFAGSLANPASIKEAKSTNLVSIRFTLKRECKPDAKKFHALDTPMRRVVP